MYEPRPQKKPPAAGEPPRRTAGPASWGRADGGGAVPMHRATEGSAASAADVGEPTGESRRLGRSMRAWVRLRVRVRMRGG